MGRADADAATVLVFFALCIMYSHGTIWHMKKRQYLKQIVLDEDVAALVEAECKQTEVPATRIVNRRLKESYKKETPPKQN